MIKVLQPGIYSSVQDQGRLGFAKMGIPVSGSMDSYSSEMGNVLLKNRRSDAVIEITFGAAKFEFTTPTFICITGSDFSPKLNDQSLEMMTAYEVSAGSILSFGKRNYGARTYVAVQGGIQSEEILKSRSFFKGITPQVRLQKGDELPILPKKPHENRGYSKVKVLDELYSSEILECYPGPEFDQLNALQKERLFQPFTISEDNNRVGYRLNEVLKNDLKSILTSAVLPGTVQLTPSGKLIVLMRDCQVTGGYPRVLQLSAFAMDILSQKLTGNTIAFQLYQDPQSF
jgi:biotin-dependent carboxylase-like uncharacterized protein